MRWHNLRFVIASMISVLCACSTSQTEQLDVVALFPPPCNDLTKRGWVADQCQFKTPNGVVHVYVLSQLSYFEGQFVRMIGTDPETFQTNVDGYLVSALKSMHRIWLDQELVFPKGSSIVRDRVAVQPKRKRPADFQQCIRFDYDVVTAEGYRSDQKGMRCLMQLGPGGFVSDTLVYVSWGHRHSIDRRLPGFEQMADYFLDSVRVVGRGAEISELDAPPASWTSPEPPATQSKPVVKQAEQPAAICPADGSMPPRSGGEWHYMCHNKRYREMNKVSCKDYPCW